MKYFLGALLLLVIPKAFTKNIEDNYTTGARTQTAPLAMPCLNGQMGGKVFNDVNGNGADDTEAGMEGLVVQIFGCAADGSSVLIETVMTDSNGDYQFTDPSIINGNPYRIEFSNIPDRFQSSIEGVDNGTETQFVDAISCDVDFGIIDPIFFCQDNPTVVTPCYVSNLLPNEDVLVSFSYNNEGTAPQDRATIAESQVAGSLWGVAYARKTEMLYTSAVLKGHVGLGPEGLDAIYLVDPFSGSPNGAAWIELTDDLGIPVSNITANPQYLDNITRELDQGSQNDAVAFQDVGKVGLGDIELSEDEETLYVVNLYDKTLYAISTSTKQLVGSFPIPDPGCVLGEARPWAIAEMEGEIFVGVTCDGSASGNPADLSDNSGAENLSATVYRLDGAAFTNVLSFPLDYPREAPFHYTGNCDQIDSWRPWLSVMPSLCDDGNVAYPTPLLTDIEFDANGDMILGFTDRTGFQYGEDNYGLVGTTKLSIYSGGDILKACTAATGWEIESVASGCSSSSGLAINTFDNEGYVPDFGGFLAKEGEFFDGDYFHDNGGIDGTGLSYFPGHPEITTGGLALIPGRGEVLTTAYDPVTGAANFSTGGVISLDLETGQRPRNGYQIYDTDLPNTTLGKGVGLGDLEILCALPPIQVGNYVWIDDNEDGIQDPCEPPVSNLTVMLYSQPTNGTPVLVATTTTDAEGEYYFTTDADLDETWEAGFTEVELDSSYFIVFAADAYDPNTDVITANGDPYTLTIVDTGMGIHPDFNDSDATEMTLPSVGTFPIISITADSTNHTFDMGLVPSECNPNNCFGITVSRN